MRKKFIKVLLKTLSAAAALIVAVVAGGNLAANPPDADLLGYVIANFIGIWLGNFILIEVCRNKLN